MSRRWQFDPFEGSPFGGQRPRPDIQLPQLPRRFWFGVGLIGLVILLLILLQPFVAFLTDLLWFGALGLQGVYLTRFWLQLALFAGSLVLALAYAVPNLVVALRLRLGALRTIGIRRRYLRTPAGAIGLGVSVVVALLVSLGAGAQWSNLVLFTHYHATGVRDPVLGQDVSFYLLTLPFLQALVDWAVGVAFLTLLLMLGFYLWRGQTFDFRLSRLAIGHLSLLLAVLALLLAVSSWINRYGFLYSHNDYVAGAGYTDIHARLPLTVIAAALALLLAVALVANAWLRLAWVPVAAVLVWVAYGILSGIIAASVQSLSVTPAEPTQERPYIQREIQFTRRAFGLSQVQVLHYYGGAAITPADLSADAGTIGNLRLWDSRPLLDTYNQLQTIRSYYSFYDINIDRYTLQGKYVQLELSARELNLGNLQPQAQTWVNEKLKYTHGYGIAASPVNAATPEGDPQFVAENIPVTGPLAVTEPDIYFGEATDDYALAPSAQPEFDHPQGNSDVYSSYRGSHGVHMDGVARALFALRTGDFNLLISSQIQARTEMLYRRNIMDRVEAIAPFLTYDSQPYIVVGRDGRLFWIIDAYTTASTYPYAEVQPAGENYIRNSVKVVVDAYEGTAQYYVAAPHDPLIEAYMGAFPQLFKPLSQIPDGLDAHLRVPQFLFSQQAQVYSVFHMTDPQVFYNREDVWAQPNEEIAPQAPPQPMAPFFVLMRLPGESAPEYLQILPFTPNGKQNMIAELAARCDPPHYGQLVSIMLPKDALIYGPEQVSRRIYESPAISRDFTLLGQVGSSIVQGNLLVVPVGDGFLYFEPVYLKANGQGQSLPELKKVILADSSQVVYEDTLPAALSAIAGTAPPSSGSPSPTVPTTALQRLAGQAYQDYQAAQARLRAGDFSGYAQDIQALGQVLQEMRGTSPAPSPSPTPSP